MIRYDFLARASMQNKSVWLNTIILPLILAGCSLLPHRGTAQPELIEQVRVKMDLAAVKRGTLTFELNAAGVVVPSKKDYLYFKIDGKLGEAAVQQGDRVKKGDVLLRLDTDQDDLQLMQQQLAVENMEAVLDKSLHGGTTDRIRIDRLNLEIERMKLNRLQDKQSNPVLVSPSDGIVTFMDDVQVGSPVTAYQDVIGIAHSNHLQIQYVGDLSAYSNGMEIGMPVTVQYKGALVKAKLAAAPWTAPVGLDPQRADILNKTLRFDFDDAIPPGLSIGDYVEFKLVITRKQNALIIPSGALRNDQGRNYVLIMEGETPREVDVQPGLVTQTQVEIVKGLSEGQQVVINQ